MNLRGYRIGRKTVRQVKTEAYGALLPRDDTILVAWVFSLLLHLPVLVGTGVFLGGREEEALRDITAIIETAAMRPLAASESGPRPFIERTAEDVEGAERAGPSLPSLSGFVSSPALSGAEDPSGEGPVPCSARKVSIACGGGMDRGASVRWGKWYAGEVRRLISNSFPYKALLKRGIHGKVVFRLQLAPDGGVGFFQVLQTEHPGLSEAAKIAVRHAGPFPPYRSLGLDFFPPFELTVRVVE